MVMAWKGTIGIVAWVGYCGWGRGSESKILKLFESYQIKRNEQTNKRAHEQTKGNKKLAINAELLTTFELRR